MNTKILFMAIGCASLCAPLNAQVINEDFKLVASDGAANDLFGFSIGIDNGIVAVGVVWDDDNGMDSGSAYLFDALSGTEIVKLVPSDGSSFDNFGRSIAIHNDVVAVGSMFDDTAGTNSGSAYFFDAVSGAQISKVFPGDGWVDDWFGASIAVYNGISAITALVDDDMGPGSGSVYLYEVSTGIQLNKLTPADGDSWDHFGQSLAMDQTTLAIGADGDDDNGMDAGSAYLFDIATGAQVSKLLAGDGSAGAGFGGAIDIQNGVVVVGALLADVNGVSSGAAYLFDAMSGAQLAKLVPTDPEAGSHFGRSVSIDNGIVVVGANKSTQNGTDSGVAYLFDVKTGEQLAKFVPTDGGVGDRFGFAVGVENNLIVVSSFHDNDNGVDSGSAYVFSALDTSCPADLTGDWNLNFFDVSAFLGAFAANDPVADFTGDGFFNFFDVSAFLAAFSAGCP